MSTDKVDYLRQLLAVTYVFEDKKQTVAFFSVLNDRISGEDSEKRVFRSIRLRSVPAFPLFLQGAAQEQNNLRDTNNPLLTHQLPELADVSPRPCQIAVHISF